MGMEIFGLVAGCPLVIMAISRVAAMASLQNGSKAPQIEISLKRFPLTRTEECRKHRIFETLDAMNLEGVLMRKTITMRDILCCGCGVPRNNVVKALPFGLFEHLVQLEWKLLLCHDVVVG